jgi:PadR family transcriptional regulator AphA
VQAARTLTPNDWIVLALVGERPTHGWALASQLARAGALGSVWPLSRPVVYHALDRLERDGAIEATGIERGGRGPHRVVYDVTPQGRKDLNVWLAAPVERVREIRSLFLVKVMLGQRTGRPVESLLLTQRATLLPLLGLLEAQLDEAGAGPSAERTLLVFRLETASSAVRFIEALLDSFGQASRAARNGSS